MPISARVSSSAQSCTTTTTLSTCARNFRGRRRSARSTSFSNCLLVTAGYSTATGRDDRVRSRALPAQSEQGKAREGDEGPLPLESADALDVHDVGDPTDRA